jgi:hypothetical protein
MAGSVVYRRGVEGLLASVVLVALLLGVLLVVVFDVFCLLRLGGTADDAHFVPRSVWAVLIVAAGPVGGLVYLFAQRLRKRSPERLTMRPGPLLGSKAWYGPAPARGGHGYSLASFEGHAVAVVGIGAAVYLALAGQGPAAAAVAVALVIIVFLKSTPPGGAREWQESQAWSDQRPGTPVH